MMSIGTVVNCLEVDYIPGVPPDISKATMDRPGAMGKRFFRPLITRLHHWRRVIWIAIR